VARGRQSPRSGSGLPLERPHVPHGNDAVEAHRPPRMARNRMRAERPGHTLCPMALVHEAYLKPTGLGRIEWRNRAQFLARLPGHAPGPAVDSPPGVG
jgi:hypothetical protein